MRSIADILMALMFFMTCLYVSYRMFPDSTQGRISEVDQWWKNQQQHLEQPQRLEHPSRVAKSKP
ncbi:MAG TPA: hypothetical protein V6D29_23690 [Leptolyngbyaceae cyanobacterium]